ncbi:MAG TPA: transposase [Candidatus Acidoferrales bacterium]|nr:transposase [Candidatus Acidoferrales bacterium]
MSNVHRLRTTDRIFFVTANLLRWVEPFAESEYPVMLDVLAGVRRQLNFLLCGYVLMPDHWHALIGVSHPLTISQVMHDVKAVSARRLNERRRTRGPVWQHQFWDRFVRHEKELSQRLEYVHSNPIRKGLVSRAEEWPWSSYNISAVGMTPGTARQIRIDHVQLPEGYRA